LILPWGKREQVSIPIPSIPAAFRREDVPDQVEPKGRTWTVRKIEVENPMDLHPWRLLPSATAATAQGMETLLEAWLSNPKARGPKPFRWKAWLDDAPREWTQDASVIMGQRIITPHLGAALWDRVQAPGERFPQITDDEHIVHQMISARSEGIRTARRGLSRACTDQERAAYLARLPDFIRYTLEEQCREERQVLWYL